MTTAINNHHPFATDLTAVSSAANFHVDFPIHATNVTVPATLAAAALMLPVPHSDLKPENPLPRTVSTPVNIANFSAALTQHPDQHLVQYLVNGLTHGFSIGFKGPHSPSQPKNLLSATATPVTSPPPYVKYYHVVILSAHLSHHHGPISTAHHLAHAKRRMDHVGSSWICLSHVIIPSTMALQKTIFLYIILS